MTDTAARRLTLTFLIALGVYTLACVFSPISWSPDSSKVAFVTLRPKEERTDVWIGDIATEKCTRVYTAAGSACAPAWSPDGKLLAFYVAPQEDKAPVRLVIVEPGGQPKEYPLKQLPEHEAGKGAGAAYMMVAPSWRPDGKAVGVSIPREKGGLVAAVDVSDGTILWQRPNCLFCSWSPDGQWVATLEPAEPELKLVLVSTKDGQAKTLRAFAGKGDGYPAGAPAWSPDGKKLCLTAPQGPGAQEGTGVWVVDAATGQARCLTDADVAGSASWSPDGKRIVCSLVLADDWDGQIELSSLVAIDVATGNRDVLVVGRPHQSVNMTTSWSPDGQWIAYWSSPVPMDKEGALFATVRLVSADGSRHKVLYASDEQMVGLAKCLIEQAEKAGENADQRTLLCEAAAQVLEELPKRFPATGLTDQAGQLQQRLKELKPQ